MNRPTTCTPIHIGKNSIGWLFCFEVQKGWYDDTCVWNTYPQVKKWLKEHTVDTNEYVIMDEYDEIVSYDEFIEIVEYSQKDTKCKNNPQNFVNSKDIDGYRFYEGEFS